MNSRGYTLLEVGLFLAISGGLTLVALVALGPRLNNVRFSSNMRGLKDSVTKHLSAGELGESSALENSTCSASGNSIAVSNTSSSAVGSRANCVLAGEVATFTNSGVLYRSVVALTEPAPCSPAPVDADSLDFIKQCNYARIVTQGQTQFEYPGGLAIVPSSAGRSVGFVRSPNGNVESRFSFTGGDSGAVQLKDATLNYSAGGDIPVCFTQGSRDARLVFSLNSSAVDLAFNEGCTP